MTGIDRRQVLLLGAIGVAVAGSSAFAAQVIKDVKDLQPGEFTWHPERAPAGPVAVIVSIPEQRVFVYRNGLRIGFRPARLASPGIRPRPASSPCCRKTSTTAPPPIAARPCPT